MGRPEEPPSQSPLSQQTARLLGLLAMTLGRAEAAAAHFQDALSFCERAGVFLLQSPAQLKMAQRLKSRNLQDLAYQVALIRPGVGVQGSAVSQFVERYRHGAGWEYDHPLEKRALGRGYGIIVWQEQVVQLIEDVAGMTAASRTRRDTCRSSSGLTCTPGVAESSPANSWRSPGAYQDGTERRT